MDSKEASRDERVGYHKGAISTLIAEQNELVRLAQITQQLIDAHAKELEKLGIKISDKTNKE